MALTDGLIAKYDLDTNANDSVGSNNGTLQGDAAFATDGDRTVLTLDGNGDYATIPDSAIFDFGTGDFSLSTWVKFSSFNAYNHMFSFGQQSNNTLYTFTVFGPSSHVGGPKLNWLHYDGGYSDHYSNNVGVALNTWHLFTAVRSSGTLKMYLDGTEQHSFSYTRDIAVSGDLHLGRRNGSSSEWINGSMDDTRIWNRALSASEVATLHSTTAATSDALVKHLKFDGNDTGMTLSGGASVTNVDGRSALAYSDHPSKAILSSPPSLAGDWTVSMWFKGLLSDTSQPGNHGWRTAARGSNLDHQIVIQGGTDNLGCYNSTTSTFIDSGFDLPFANYTGWHHIAAVGTGSTTAYYVDGNYAGSIAFKSSDNIAAIGNDYVGGQQFADYTDDVRIYNKALTQTEIQSIMTGYDAITLETGLVAKYDLNTNANDSVGSNNGTATNITFATEGDRSYAESDATGNKIDFGNPAPLDFGTGDFTVSGWAYFDDTDPAVSSFAVLSKGMTGADNPQFRGFYMAANSGNINWMVGGGGSYTFMSTPANTGQWYHVVGTRSGTAIKLYVDGAEAGSGTSNFVYDVTTPLYAATLAAYDIGAPGDHWHTTSSDGKVDDLRIWNRALSASEVATLHSTTAATSDALVKHLKFDGNDTGMTLSGGASVTNVDGRSALALDGTGDYLTLPGSSDFDFGTADFTLGFWMKPTNTTQWAALMSSPNYWTSGYSGNWGIDIYNYPGIGSKIRLYSYGDGQAPASELAYVSSVVLTTEWQHIVFVRDSGTLKCFINGVESGSTRADNFSTADLSDGVNGLYLGHTAPGSGTDFDGSIDDVRIYNKALTQTEIQSIMTGYDTPDTTAPVITVLGTNPATVNAGATYTDAGATALDNIDGAVAVVTTGAVTTADVVTGLTKRIKFDGNDTEVTLAGNASLVTVDGRTAGSFPADGDYLDLPDVAATGNAPRSIAFWVKYLGSAQKNTSYVNFVFTGTSANSQAFSVVSYGGTHGVPGIMGYNNDFYPTTGTAINDDTWHHVAATFDGTTLKMYVDGALDNSTTKTFNTQGQNNAAALHVGNTLTLRGKMDDLRFYDRAITAAEVTTIYDSAGADILGAVAGTYTLTYTATDAASNVATATRTVNVIADTTAPVITVLGSSPVTVAVGAVYTDAGATALDNIDGAVAVVTTGLEALSSTNVTSGLTKHLKFDGSDTEITLAGNASMVSVDGRTAGSFVADGDYIDLPDVAATGNAPRSIAFWVKYLGSAQKETSYVSFVNTGTGTANSQSFNVVSYGGTHGVPGIMGYNNDFYPTTGTAINDDTWHHVAATFDGTTLKMYVDGALDNSTTKTYNTQGQDNKVARTNWNGGGGGAQTLRGKMDDLRFYDRALTAAEVTTIYDSAGADTFGAQLKQLDANFSDVTLLLPLDTDLTDASTSGHTVTAVGNAAISTSEKKFGAGSLALDGTGDFLTLPAHSDWNLSSGDFTVEAWAYANSVGSVQGTILTIGSLSATCHLQIAITPDRKPVLAWNSGTNWTWTTILVGPDALATGQWHHFAAAFDRTNSTAKLYVNGIEVASAASPHQGPANDVSIGNISSLLTIGSYFENGYGFLDGFIDDIRITKGLARYTANFAVPTAAHPLATTMQSPSAYTVTYTATDAASNVATATRTVNVEDDTTAPVITVLGDNPAAVVPGATYTDAGATAVDNIDGAVAVVTTGVDMISETADAHWNDVALLLNDDDADASSTSQVITGANNLPAVVVDPETGVGNVLYFDGNACMRIEGSAGEVVLGTNDFTFETWFKTGNTGAHALFDFRESATGGTGSQNATMSLNYPSQSIVRVWSSSSPVFDWNGGAPITNNTWAHLALTRESNTLRLFINGTLINSTTTTRDFNASCDLFIGGDSNNNWRFVGYMKQLRLTRGVARYTSSFSAPTEAHPTAASGGAITGTHTVTYTATDAASNVATATRTVNVADPSNYSTLSDGVNRYNYIANSGVVGLAVPTALVGLKKSSADEAGIHIDLDEYLHGTAGVTVWAKDFSDNWTVWDATPQEHFELAWLDTIESVFFQLGSASSRDIRILKVQGAVRYDADKTDASDDPQTFKSAGEAPVAISGIYSEPVVESRGQLWAQGEVKIFTTASSRSSLIQLWTYSGNVATLAKATEFEIDVNDPSQASITKLSAGIQDVKVRIMD